MSQRDGRSGKPARLAVMKQQCWIPAGHSTLEKNEALAFAAVYHGPEPDRVALAVLAAGTGWLPVVAGEPPEWRSALLRVLLETDAFSRKPPARIHRLLATLRWLRQPDAWLERTRWALKALTQGANPCYLAACLRWHLRHRLVLPLVPPNAVTPTARRLRLLIRHGGSHVQKQPAEAWNLLSLDRDGLLSRAALAMLGKGGRIPAWGSRLFSDFCDLNRTAPEKRWRRALFIRLAPALLKAAAGMDLENAGCCRMLVDTWISKAPTAWPGMGDELLFWLRRVAVMSDPLPWKGSVFLVHCCARLNPEGRALLRTWTDEQFGRLARMADGWGFQSDVSLALNADLLPQSFLAAAVHGHLRDMVEILTALSQLRPEFIRRVWQSMIEHPLCSCDPVTTPLRQAVVLMDAVSDGREDIPDLPGSVRRLIASRIMPSPENTAGTSAPRGNASPSAARLAEARRLVARRWWHLAVRVLKRLVDWEIRRGFPGLKDSSGVSLHTLCMAMRNHEYGDNAAPTRLLVRAVSHGHGHRAWALSLPLNRQWLTRHPEGSHPAWQEGLAAVVRLPELAGETVLWLEDDLQEILRMGTRFGTCLSLGGCNGHSPAAVALDANKRVLYARGPSGKIIARQLLALAENRGLVCFTVYAHRHWASLRNAFATYNQMLAQLLRIPLWRSGDDYEIARIVCRDWYDDGFWQSWKDDVELAS